MNDINLAGNSKSCIDILGNTWTYDCMGCAVTSGNIKVPGGVIYDGKYCILACDPEVPIPGFLIVNIKRHIKSYRELTKEERYEISDVISCAENALKDLNICSEFTLVQEERSRHLHIWIFPNYEWMNEKFDKGITNLRSICEYATNNIKDIDSILDVANKVRLYFNDNFNKE